MRKEDTRSRPAMASRTTSVRLGRPAARIPVHTPTLHPQTGHCPCPRPPPPPHRCPMRLHPSLPRRRPWQDRSLSPRPRWDRSLPRFRPWSHRSLAARPGWHPSLPPGPGWGRSLPRRRPWWHRLVLGLALAVATAAAAPSAAAAERAAAGAPGPSPSSPAGPPAGSVPASRGGLWGWPLAGRPPVTRAFDPPADPYGPGHRGVDLSGAPGDAVLAA